MREGTLYIVPVVLSVDGIGHIPPLAIDLYHRISCWCAENGKTFRHYLKEHFPEIPLQELEYMEYDKHSQAFPVDLVLSRLREGKDVGLVSEAGLPSVADPGSRLVARMHREGIDVVPVSGPGSMMLALMASGLNGQNFCFHGYLPIDQTERVRKIRDLCRQAESGAAQAFMETPYRNASLWQDLLANVPGNLHLCLACNLTSGQEIIRTRSLSEWKNLPMPKIQKIPAIFILGRNQENQ